MSKRAVMYLRVSSVGQVNTAHDPEGYSIPGQREACERYASGLDAVIVGEYVEPGKTGTNLKRPALQRLLGDLPDLQPDYVIAYDLSRASRDEFDAFCCCGKSGAWCRAKIDAGRHRQQRRRHAESHHAYRLQRLPFTQRWQEGQGRA